MEKYDSENPPPVALAHDRPVTWNQKLFNILGCVVAMPLYYVISSRSRYPATLDLVVLIALAELNRFINESRRSRAASQSYATSSPISEKNDLEKQSSSHQLDTIAAVVGWREDPALFTRALESYKAARQVAFMLIGIDGDEDEDQDMARVFKKVFPHQSRSLHIPEPLGMIAERYVSDMIYKRTKNGEEINETEIHELAVRHCVHLARAMLARENIEFDGPDGVRRLCLQQKHVNKKGIMFTTYIFAIIIAEMIGVEFLWSSDSDTLPLPDSIEKTVTAIASDSRMGGASSGLRVLNEDETIVTKLSSTVYWGELYLTRSAPAPTATSDCQSGPSTVFRISTLPGILVPWYLQRIWGKRMIVNEDRHLTTNLLIRGWGVVFTSDTLTTTETPTTLRRWIMQQVRWGRSTHVESLLQPKVYLMNHPLIFYATARRETGPTLACLSIIYYFLAGKTLIIMSMYDIFIRLLFGALYNVARNPQRMSLEMYLWVIPGIIFYYIPLPAIHLWSLVTMTADGWGTSMRSASARSRASTLRKDWWEMGFFIIWMGIVAGSITRKLALSYELSDDTRILYMTLSFIISSVTTWKVVL